jgi:hypothetical protein
VTAGLLISLGVLYFCFVLVFWYASWLVDTKMATSWGAVWRALTWPRLLAFRAGRQSCFCDGAH